MGGYGMTAHESYTDQPGRRSTPPYSDIRRTVPGRSNPVSQRHRGRLLHAGTDRWDAAIIAEDRDMLESTDPDAIVDMGRKIEKHMPSDQPAC